ncbi:hypothetical protein HK101_001256 [Irineochytrium annulatum]|nr:hypothetical protein HK101_001256 [Irineochytrium annulatum]
MAAGIVVLSSIALFTSLQILVAVPSASRDPSTAPLTNALAPPCDPYALPGRLHPDFVFRPFDGPLPPGLDCRVVTTTPTDNLSAVSRAAKGEADLPGHLRNRMVLIVGDSNDRNTIISFCQHIGGTSTAHMILDASIIPPGEDNQGDARLCVVREPNPSAGTGHASGVLVIAFIFNYGITNDSGEHRNHVRPGLSALFVDVVDSIPPFLNKLAPVHFPELLLLLPPSNHDHAGAPPSPRPPVIAPDLIVAQSSLWDLAMWVSAIRDRIADTNVTFDVEDTMSYGLSRLPADLQSRFLPSFARNFAGVPLVWRTCPSISRDDLWEQRPAWVVSAYNRFVGLWLGRLGVRLLDWDAMVKGRAWDEDGVHQGFQGRMVYSQMILAELERMEEVRLWRARLDFGEVGGSEILA